MTTFGQTRSIYRFTAFILTFALASSCIDAIAEERGVSQTPPNIVIILIDDLGYADIGPFRAMAHKTPHLDQMAREGRTFTDFHSATAVCSASRAALLTGCYPERVSILGALSPTPSTASTLMKSRWPSFAAAADTLLPFTASGIWAIAGHSCRCSMASTSISACRTPMTCGRGIPS
jgi:predicted AlkP superfamily pyrophosphatase or phosphodiesterase